MAERLSEIELEEIQELKENAERKCWKQKHEKESTTTCSWEEGAFSTPARRPNAVKALTSLSPRVKEEEFLSFTL